MRGLSQLINDPFAEPQLVIGLLQRMFDRFDRLADVFQLQKARFAPPPPPPPPLSGRGGRERRRP